MRSTWAQRAYSDCQRRLNLAMCNSYIPPTTNTGNVTATTNVLELSATQPSLTISARQAMPVSASREQPNTVKARRGGVDLLGRRPPPSKCVRAAKPCEGRGGLVGRRPPPRSRTRANKPCEGNVGLILGVRPPPSNCMRQPNQVKARRLEGGGSTVRDDNSHLQII